MRLARFNTQIGSVDKRYFIGLASPSAAALVAGTVWCFSDFGIQGSKLSLLVALMVAAAGMLMVSNFKYWSFKTLGLKGRVPFVVILIACWSSPWSSPTRRACCCWASWPMPSPAPSPPSGAIARVGRASRTRGL